ncbi:tetratricopeptide repeat protein [Okeania sp.]|uniref:tetratricopeptide repeat protein n=1 Tax=Okeania sp. TaxID=3100323 RepID=UPI002B4AD2FF|nr:tetratricopeptide repeat protein [Okeania sp.]MEB3341706.1 tetratricopeptide repeat protein [Okeania sp.]
MLLPAVLHPDIVEFLRKEVESNLQKKVWECIQRLKQQKFNSGLRVKKLKGINKRVWEARINSASRLIFTYDKSQRPETGETEVYLVIQDICLDHDDVSRRAKARQKKPDYEWLETTEFELIVETKSFQIQDDDADENVSYSSAEEANIEAAKALDLEINSDFTDDELLGNVEWRVLESETEWQKAIIEQNTDLPLKLTPEEYKLAKLSGNLLLNGSAGTGKTTIALYRMLQKKPGSNLGKRLYIAYNNLLVNNAEEQFQKILTTNSPLELESESQDSTNKIVFEFKNLQKLCLEILSNCQINYSSQDEVNYQVFSEMYKAHPSRKQYSTTLVWEEIRGMIKGKQLEITRSILSEKEYQKISKNSITSMYVKQRKEIYKIAEWYQKKLEKERLYDEIDLVREVLRLIKKDAIEQYDLIVCDEVQDLTEIQLKLLFDLASPSGNLFFAGDSYQMISPSGFRWETLKDKFYPDRTVDEQTLKFNFRSVGSLVKLANQLLKLRSRYLAEPTIYYSKTNSFYGQPARLISADNQTLVRILKETSISPGDAILVRKESDKEKIRAELNSSFVFTIEEIKGLEFDTVFIVDFFQTQAKLWGKAIRGGVLKEKEKPQLQLELNLLYVAITRASRILNIWESKLSQLWQESELIGLFQSIIPELVTSDRIEPSLETWRKQGEYYLKAEFYQQAKECFSKSGDITLEKHTEAKLLIQKQLYNEAVEILLELTEWQEAAVLFEKLEKWQEAGICWANIGEYNHEKICEAYQLESSSKWSEAAKKWEEVSNFANAKRCWMNVPEKKAEYSAMELEEKEEWLKAALEYEVAKMPDKAIFCRAREYQKRNRWEEAISRYESVGMDEEAEKCRQEAINILYKRGLFKLKNKDYNGALEDYNRALVLESNNHLLYQNKAIILAEMGNLKEAAKNFKRALEIEPEHVQSYYNLGAAYVELGEFNLAIKVFSQALESGFRDYQIYQNLGVAYFKAGDHQEAIVNYNQAITLNPHKPEIYYNRGVAHRFHGNNQNAIDDLTKVLQLNPQAADAYTQRGIVKCDMRDLKGATADFDEAIKLNPQDPEPIYKRAIIRRMYKDNEGSLADFNEVIKIRPKYADAYIRRGRVRFELDDHLGALDDLDYAVQLQPKNAEAYYHRGNTKLSLSNFDGARYDFEVAITYKHEYYQAYNDLGVVYLRTGDILAAIRNFETAIQINSHYADAYNNLGYTKFNLGYSGAIKLLEKAIEINPNYAEAYNNLGNCRLKTRDFQGAIRDFGEILRINPKHISALNNRALAYLRLEDFSKAIADCHTVLEIAPNYALAYYNLGLIHTEMGDLEQAILDYNESLRLSPQNIDSYMNRGRVYYKLNNYTQAVQDQTSALSINPNIPQAYRLRSEGYIQLGQLKEAINDLQKAVDIYQQQAKPQEYKNMSALIEKVEIRNQESRLFRSRDQRKSPRFTGYFNNLDPDFNSKPG